MMEIKTTRDIDRELRELIINAKDIDKINMREDYLNKKWVSVDSVVDFLKELKLLFAKEYVDFPNELIYLLIKEKIKKLEELEREE